MSDQWTIVRDRFGAATNRADEGLFTLGSGYLHVRGSLEEHLADAPQNVSYRRTPTNTTAEKFPEMPARWGTYVPGIFGRHPLLNDEMVNLPWFLDLCPAIDGQEMDVQRGDVSDFRRQLDLRRAVLRRTLTWRTPDGQAVCVEYERFVSAARKHLCVQRMTLRGRPGTRVLVRAGIDADVRTNGHDHLTDVRVSRPGDDKLQCDVTTDRDDRVRIRSRLVAEGADWSADLQPRRARLSATLTIGADGELSVVKLSTVTTSRDLGGEDAAGEPPVCSPGADWAALLAEHEAVWADRWAKADVAVDGDDRSQLALRCAIYHLLRFHCDDPRVSIDAKGAAGEAYFGRYFWDTEMNLLPFYLYTHPAMARTLVEFRRRTLDGARANARAYGYRGARYPHQSDDRGVECTANWQYRDHEVHPGADVIFAMDHFDRAVEAGYCSGPAAEAIVEAARYWLDRVDWRAGEDHPSLLGVMGPDEYCPISHNNSYTNRLVAHALATAARVGRAGGASEAEIAQFARVAAGLPILRDPARNLVLQCEDWDLLAEPDFDRDWPDRSKLFANCVSQEKLYRTKALKQADVLLLMVLFPAEFTQTELRAAWDYYVPRTTHDSSLSAGVHAVVACRLGLDDQAWAFWQQACAMDLDGKAAEGVHAAAMGNTWQMAVLGFAGMATALDADALTLRPRLPKAWKRLAFPVVWKGCGAYVEITPEHTCITNRGDRELHVCVNGRDETLAPSATETFR